MRNIIKNRSVFLVIIMASFSAFPRELMEARLSIFLKESDNAEIYQITSAGICDRKKTGCMGQFVYKVKFEEVLYGSDTRAQIYHSDYDISVGSYALIFSKRSTSVTKENVRYYGRFYELKKTIEIPLRRESKYTYLVNVGESHLLEDIPSLPLPSQENYEICVSGKCKNYGAGVFIKYQEFASAVKKYRAINNYKE